MSSNARTPELVVREVTANSWKDFERLFESKGGPKYCWCMAWRATKDEVKSTDSSSRKAAMASRVMSGIPVGLLGYINGEPVAWCSIAPRPTYRRLVRDQTSENSIWSIACFFVAKEYRRRGLTSRMLAAALRHARQKGARIVEAYPVDADSPSYRFMGFVPMFEKAGFVEIGREGSRRHVMQRKVRPLRK